MDSPFFLVRPFFSIDTHAEKCISNNKETELKHTVVYEKKALLLFTKYKSVIYDLEEISAHVKEALIYAIHFAAEEERAKIKESFTLIQ
ncbi:MAG TPA: hypothetical protein DDW88_03925 [Treponema sp.]|nr:hypothetical protein [Treponema sp.]